MKIEERLEPGETVIKQHSRAHYTEYTTTRGDLYLTNRYLRYVGKRGLIRTKPLNIRMPLRDIREVTAKGFPSYQLIIQSDQEYRFGFSKTRPGKYEADTKEPVEWTSAIQQARQTILPQTPEAGLQAKTPRPRIQLGCPTCNNHLTWIQEYSRWYCYNCKEYIHLEPQVQTPPLPTTPTGPRKYCTKCGTQLRFEDFFCPRCGNSAR